MARWDEIVYRAAKSLADEGFRDVDPADLLSELKRVQVDICRRAFALQGTASITTVAAQEAYSVVATIFRIKQVFEPSAWTKDVEPIHDATVWHDVKRSRSILQEQPLFVTVWNGEVLFYYPPATADLIVTLWTYNLPSNVPALEADPDIASFWDDALEWGCIGRMLEVLKEKNVRASGAKAARGAMDWLARYEAEVSKRRNEEVKQMKQGVLRKRSRYDRLGF